MVALLPGNQLAVSANWSAIRNGAADLAYVAVFNSAVRTAAVTFSSVFDAVVALLVASNYCVSAFALARGILL